MRPIFVRASSPSLAALGESRCLRCEGDGCDHVLARAARSLLETCSNQP
jgi:hypothetical protein